MYNKQDSRIKIGNPGVSDTASRVILANIQAMYAMHWASIGAISMHG